MATEKLQIILDAVYRGANTIRSAQRDLGGLNRAAEGATKGAKSLGSQLGITAIGLGTVAVAARGAYQAIGEGAALSKSRDEFDKLSKSIGSTSEAMLTGLRAATRGLMSDAELVASAGQIMSLGLQDTEDGVVRLTAVAGKLGWDMSQVILTMANDSVMRLDALGLSVEGVNEKMRRLMSEGFSKGEAFDLAVIEAGEEKVLLLGDAADTASGKMAALETVFKNVNDAFKESLAESVAEGLFDAADGALALNDALVTAATNGGAMAATIIMETIGDLQALAAIAQDIADGNFGAASRVDWRGMAKAFVGEGFTSFSQFVKQPYAGSRRSSSGGVVGVANPTGPHTSPESFGHSTAAIESNTAAIGRSRASILDWKENMQTAADQQRYWRDSIDESTAALAGGGSGRGGGGGLVNALRDSAEAMAMLSAESGDLFSRLRGAKDFNLAEELFSLGDKMGAGALDLAQFGVTAGLFDQARADELLNQSYMLTNAQQMLDAGMTLSEVYGALQGQQGNMTELATNFFSTIDQTSAEATLLLETQPGYDELDAFVSAVETANPVMTVTANFPSIPGGPAPEPRAIGGPVYGGEPYIVGERGPELFVPSGNGRIIPNGQGGGGHTFNFYNRESTALAMTSLGLARRAGLDRRMGVA